MQIFRNLLVVAIAVAPLAFAIPAEAGNDDSGAPTYTCDTVIPSGPTVVLGEQNCVASNGAPNTPGIPITIGRSFLITARMGDKQTFSCDGGDASVPGGDANLPTTVTGNYCHLA
jgi:hypothetical protein